MREVAGKKGKHPNEGTRRRGLSTGMRRGIGVLSRKFQLAKEYQDWFTLSQKGEVILFSLQLIPLLKGKDYTFLFFRSQNCCTDGQSNCALITSCLLYWICTERSC